MKSTSKLILSVCILFLCGATLWGQRDYKSVTVRHIEMLKTGPDAYFDEADAMFDKVMRPVVMDKGQLRTKKGFVFARVKGLNKSDRNWLRKNGFTATDDLWIVIPESMDGGTVDVEELVRGKDGFRLAPETSSMKLSCGAACEGQECVEKRCGSLPKRRCVSCSGCCESRNAVGGSTYLIPSYETI